MQRIITGEKVNTPQDVHMRPTNYVDGSGAPPPHSLEAEQGFLGALLLWNQILEDVPFLTPDHFFDPLHGYIFTLAADLIRKGRTANPVTLRPSVDGLEPVGALPVSDYLVRLGIHAASQRTAKDTAQVIVDLSDRRQLILIGEDVVAAAREANATFPPKSLIEEAEARLFALAEYNQSQLATTVSFGDAAAKAVRFADAAYRGEKTGLMTGIVDLDAKLGGLQPTDLIVLAGRPSMGKTALATNIAFHVAKTTPVHFFSLEMSAEQLAMRVLGAEINVSASRLRTGKVQESQIKALTMKAGELRDVSLHTDELGGASITQVVARARRMKRKHGTGLIIVDYLQLMQASRRTNNRVQDITEITTGLKALAKELHVPIIAVSQLSRETERRDNKRPQLADLRESGSIEQDADVVMFTFREEYYVERDAPDANDQAKYAEWQTRLQQVAGKAEIIIGKARHHELGSVPVAFNGALTRFSDLAREAGR